MTDLQDKKKVIATSIASPLASLIAKYITYPIDTVKTKIQARVKALHSFNSYQFGHSFQTVKQIWKSQGIKGFFPGVTLAAFGSIIAYSAYMTTYEKSKQMLGKYQFFKEYPSANHLLSGFHAQIASCIFWLPIDIIKQRMQVQSEVKIYHYNNPVDAMKKINRSQGLIGLYRAFGATLVFFGPVSAIFFVTYEKLKKILSAEKDKPSFSESLICSAGAGAVSGFLTTPLQIIKMRMQIQRADSALKHIPLSETLYGYRNIFHGLYTCFKKQGLLALYKGAGLRVMFTIPIFTISITLTEEIRKQVLRRRLQEYFL